ncbi:MAG: cysteine--tRNA ligase [Alphaproteobacteria bacterium]|jgi:cysteinyl-tRNA synthetase|nr:cysteine--tRNA ligase [Candidatus Jidaibacter sp.]
MVHIYLSNTLSHKKELFEPIDANNIRMYACGPTVYDRPHLGNARSAVAYDILYRLLKAVYAKVTYVRNITDVDDKIINTCKQTGDHFLRLTKEITQFYHEDMAALNCLSPDFEPRATQHIENMIFMIKTLIAKGFAYEAEGHVLFAVKQYQDYGLLSNRSIDEVISGARVEIAPYKADPRDFVLWKPSPSDEHEFGFDSPWGRGRPGWHIECSAMTKAILGEYFDIHGGGADLTFPHHENELAQSVCSSESNQFVKYWVHNGFLMVNGEKMSKSLNNFFTVRDMLNKGIDGAAIRLIYLGTHYKKPLDFSEKAIEDAKKTLNKFREFLHSLEISIDESFVAPELLELLADDMNTVSVIAKMHELIAHYKKTKSIDSAKSFIYASNLLGINLSAQEDVIPDDIMNLAKARTDAKLKKDWVRADQLREQLESLGYKVEDRKTEFFVKKI